MYVSYLVEKESNMYPGSLRCANSGGGLPAQNFVPAPAYSDYVGYHPAPGAESNSHSHHHHHHHHHGQSSAGWGPHYGAPREDWSAYEPGPSSAVPAPLTGLSPGQVSYSSPDYSSLPPAPGSGVMALVDTGSTVQNPPSSQRHHSYEWMRKNVQSTASGKTRTKEKYRVVYTDHQRLELEKEFHSNRYITIRRKSELAASLGLSDRQVKIWFQNRRAKERKLIKKKIGQFDGSGGSVQSDSGSVSPAELTSALFPPPPHAMNGL
ncbi:homeobox protein CDX-4-like [Rhinatrema bivittatum]|uniref:homeobox protein CDX-4-like n=1 Tax=Rhinatrema bivittatum TaxID=194408 RepID=UPI00112BDB03|nr:homeobox protein CDX-4-like [Rhinatrema bivittatum]